MKSYLISKKMLVFVAAGTSNISRALFGDHLLAVWKEALLSLPKRSMLRTATGRTGMKQMLGKGTYFPPRILCRLLILCLGILGPLVLPGYATAVTMPEFYGVYFIEGDKFTDIKNNKAPLPPNLQFLVFAKEIGAGISQLQLSRVPYLRNFVLIQGYDVPETLPPQVRYQQLNKWFVDNQELPKTLGPSRREVGPNDLGTASIELRSKPVRGQNEAVIVAPAQPLAPGVYRMKTPIYNFSFTVPPANKETDCVDLHIALDDIIYGMKLRRCAGSTWQVAHPSLKADESQAGPAGAPSSGAVSGRTESTMTALTKGMPDAEYFLEKDRLFQANFDHVWAAANQMLATTSFLKKKADNVERSDRDQGLLITEPTVHSRLLGENFRRQYVILMEREGSNSTRVTVKGFCYDRKGLNKWERRQAPDVCSEWFLQDLNKELSK